MSTQLDAQQWRTARALHQIQLLSCDLVSFKKWRSSDLAAPFWRLYWHDLPGTSVVVGARKIRIPPRRLFLVPPNTHFSCENTAPFRQLFVHFLLEPAITGAREHVYALNRDKTTDGLVSTLIRNLAEKPESPRLSLLAQALVSLALTEIPEKDWCQRFGDSRITEAAASIRAKYPGRTNNNLLAVKAGMHVGAFLRLFRKETGQSPGEYLSSQRLEEACVLLQSGAHSIEEIAEKTGFCDRAHFSRFFTKRMGIAPAKYGKTVKSENCLRR